MNWKHQGVRWALSVCLMTGLALAIVPTSDAQTADGVTPAEEDICTTWGMTGKVNGLCNAYCEAMDCDSAEPQASEQACSRVLGKIEGALGETPFPTCVDVDNDGVPNGLDNCPDSHNPGQEDANTGTPEGDVCEPLPGAACLCLGAAPGVPSTPAELLADAESYHTANPLAQVATFCSAADYGDQRAGSGSGFSASWRLINIPILHPTEPPTGECTLVRTDDGMGEVYRANVRSLTNEEHVECTALAAGIRNVDPLGACN